MLLEGAGVGDMRGGFGEPSFRVGGRPGDMQDENLPSTSHSPCPLPSGSPSAHQTDGAPTKVPRDKLTVHMVAYF